MKRNLYVFFILLSLLMPSAAFARTGIKTESKTAVSITAEERKMAEAITAEQLKEYLYFVASDEMGGRDTPSRGLDITAQFIALMLKRWKFKPAGDDGTFFQKMMIRKEMIDSSKMNLSIGGTDFQYVTNFFGVGGKGTAEGSLVFVKDGWMVKSKNMDAFAGVDVKDKIVVVYNDNPSRGISMALPKGVTGEEINSGKKGIDWADPVTYAEMKGAKGVIMIASPQVENIWDRLANFMGRSRSSVVNKDQMGQTAEEDSIPVMLANKDIAAAIFNGADGDQKSAKAFAINKTASIGTGGMIEMVPTQNVVAVWEGSDAKLKNEYVAIGAHYDHVGTNEDAPGDDKIWNGADDDGSGTVGVLAIAEALAKAPKRPKRSVLFVWHAGEEHGLWGSKYFNENPTVNIKNVVAQLNIDMIGRSLTPETEVVKCGPGVRRCNEELSKPNEIYVIGSEMMSSKLGEITKETNSSYLNLDYNYRYDDPKDPNRFFFRSDHFNYAVNGIPIVFWFDGVHMDYHQPSDSPDKIDYQKMEKVARTIFLTMWELTELDDRPVIDKQLPPELTRRS